MPAKKTKICPFCGEEILEKAIKCRYCGEFLDENYEEKIDYSNKSEKESKQKTSKPLTRYDKIGIQLLIFIAGVLLSTVFSLFSRIWIIVSVIFCIRYAFCSGDDKYIVDFKSYIKPERYKNKKRIIVAGILSFIFGGLALIVCVNNYLSERAEEQRKADYAAAPVPVIEVLSQEGNIGSGFTYKFEANITGASEVKINREDIEITGGKISKTFNLTDPKLEIIVSAKNEYKSSERIINVERDLTEEEAEAIRIAEEERLAKEKAEAEAREKQRVDDALYELNEHIDLVKNVDTTIFNVAMSVFAAARGQINKFSEDSNKTVKDKAAALKKALINSQKNNFPKIRNNYCKKLKELYRSQDIEVQCNNTTMTFIATAFVRNSNIAEFHKGIIDILQQGRWKRVNYKWTKSSYADYTYFTIDSLNDGDF